MRQPCLNYYPIYCLQNLQLNKLLAKENDEPGRSRTVKNNLQFYMLKFLQENKFLFKIFLFRILVVFKFLRFHQFLFGFYSVRARFSIFQKFLEIFLLPARRVFQIFSFEFSTFGKGRIPESFQMSRYPLADFERDLSFFQAKHPLLQMLDPFSLFPSIFRIFENFVRLVRT